MVLLNRNLTVLLPVDNNLTLANTNDKVVKMGKAKKSVSSKPARNVPLGQQLLDETEVRPTGRVKKRDRKHDDDTVRFVVEIRQYRSLVCVCVYARV